MKRVALPESQPNILFPQDITDNMIVIAVLFVDKHNIMHIYKLSSNFDVHNGVIQGYIWQKLDDCCSIWAYPSPNIQEAILTLLQSTVYIWEIYVFDSLQELGKWLCDLSPNAPTRDNCDLFSL